MCLEWDSLPVDGPVTNEWARQDWTQPVTTNTQEQTYWELSEDPPESDNHPVFPEAIPQSSVLVVPTITQSEATSVQSTNQQTIVQQQATQIHETKNRKRIARSLIPTIPVEMPQEEGDPLDLQVAHDNHMTLSLLYNIVW